jgi:hypothetical protein
MEEFVKKPNSTERHLNINLNSKAGLARLLAVEGIRVEHHAKAKTAYFELRNRVLVLPMWKNMSEYLYDMLLIHETGHALDTPPKKWEREVKRITTKYHGSDENPLAIQAVHNFMNVIEDARIDKRQKRRYPGSRRDYYYAYKELFEKNLFDTEGKDLNSYAFIDRSNVYFKGGHTFNLRFTTKEMGFIKRMENAETFDEVVQLTDEIYDYAKNEENHEHGQQLNNLDKLAQEAQEALEKELKEKGEKILVLHDKPEGAEPGKGGGSGDPNSPIMHGYVSDKPGDAGDPMDMSNTKIIDQRTNKNEAGQGGGKGKDGPEGKPEKAKEEGRKVAPGGLKGGKSGGSSAKDFIPESATEKAWQERQSWLVRSDQVEEFVYCNLPVPNLDTIVDDYPKVVEQHSKAIEKKMASQSPEMEAVITRTMTAFRAQENRTISFMVEEFEKKKAADTYSKIQTSRTGILNMNKIHGFKFNDDIFKRNTIIPVGKNHGFVMMIDWSSSMSGVWKNTIKQVLSLAFFCKRVQIPFDVYLFRDPIYEDRQVTEYWKFKKGSLNFSNVKLRNILSSRMNFNVYNKAIFNLFYMMENGLEVDGMTGTPLNEALVALEAVAKRFQATNKVQIMNLIVLTDGEGNGVSGIHGSGYAGYGNSQKRYICFDPITGKNHDLGNAFNGDEVTACIITVIRQRLASKVLGFYLHNSFGPMMGKFCADIKSGSDDYKKKTETWKKEGYFTASKSVTGYNEFYVVDTSNLRLDEGKINVQEGKRYSTAKLKDEFVKAMEKKVMSRMLLRRFITQIAESSS